MTQASAGDSISAKQDIEPKIFTHFFGMPTSTPPQSPVDISLLDEFFKEHQEIAAAYIFGSYATGRTRPGSDVDIALMLRKPIPQLQRIEWETSLSNLLKKDVDLVIFSQATPLLQHQILKYGILIKETDPKARVRQETRARSEYLDTMHLFKELKQAHG